MEKKTTAENAGADSPRKAPRRPRGAKPDEGGDEAESAGCSSNARNDVMHSENGEDNGVEPDATCEDVSVAVAGKKALRGKVWRARNGDYIRYRCIDDGSEYRPGGNTFVYSSSFVQLLPNYI